MAEEVNSQVRGPAELASLFSGRPTDNRYGKALSRPRPAVFADADAWVRRPRPCQMVRATTGNDRDEAAGQADALAAPPQVSSSIARRQPEPLKLMAAALAPTMSVTGLSPTIHPPPATDTSTPRVQQL